MGLSKGDRVAALIPNIPEAVIAMLATTSIGAIWSSCSPDFGIEGILDRFSQINPKLIISSDGYFYKGKNLDALIAFTQASVADKTSGEIHFNLALMQHQQGKQKIAKNHFTLALKFADGNKKILESKLLRKYLDLLSE